MMGPWETLYFAGTYACAAVCIYAAINRGIKEGWRKGALEVSILIFFVVAYWLLESMAHVSAPFYGYPPIFPDMIPYFDWTLFGASTSELVLQHTCMNQVIRYPTITLTVPVLETCVTYSVMWTARLLLTSVGWVHSVPATLIAPFLAGLVTLLLDAFLDPIVSQSYSCTTPAMLHHDGLGYWKWFANADLANIWFGIPAFNYAAWYAAPVLLITFVLLIHWIWEWVLYLRGISSQQPSLLHGLARLAIFVSFLVVHVTAPDHEPPWEQIAAIVLAIVISLIVVLKHRGQYDRNHAFRWEFVLPQVFFFSLPVFQLFLTGKFSGLMWPVLLPITIVFSVTGIWFAFTPYTGSRPAASP